MQQVHDRLTRSREEMLKKLANLTAKIDELESQLPDELRFSTTETRAQIATQVVQAMLETKLNLAVNQARIDEHEDSRKDENIAEDSLEFKKAVADYRKRVIEFEAAASQLKSIEKLDEWVEAQIEGVRRRADNAFQVSKIDLEIARVLLDSVRNEPIAKLEASLAELRIEKSTLQARLAVADEFLNRMRESAQTIRELEQLQRQSDLINKDLAQTSAELGKFSLKIVELECLQELIHAAPAEPESQQPEE